MLCTSLACSGAPRYQTPSPDDVPTEDTSHPGQTTPSSFASSVVLNELLASNEQGATDTAGEREDWIELFHRGSTPQPLTGWTIDVGDETFEFPDDWTMSPGDHVLIWCDGEPEQGASHAPFKLGRDQAIIVLFNADGVAMDRVSWSSEALGMFGEQTPDVSIGRLPDGGSIWTPLSPPSPHAPNVDR